MATQTTSCFSWNDKIISFIFRKMSDTYPNLKNHSLSVFQLKMVFGKNSTVVPQFICSLLFLKTATVLQYAPDVLYYILPIWSYRVFKRCLFKVWDFAPQLEKAHALQWRAHESHEDPAHPKIINKKQHRSMRFNKTNNFQSFIKDNF